MTRTFPILALAIFLLPAAAFGQRDLKVIPDPDPELERKTFQLADGFEVNLFAADPKIAKPIQMNFDAAGRLWIASSEVYPHIKPGEKARDRVIVLEDKDADGRSDVTHTFAEGLLIPTGVLPGDGGAYVANSTQLLHFADDDGDLKADRKRIILSGFGTEDTHHILHTLRWGPDGMMYMNQSIYIHSHIETPWGVRRLNAGGVWQFRPETMRLEVSARGWVNPWGHQFSRYGQSFVTDGAGGEGINYLVPGASYVTAYGAPRILPGLNPGSPKYCGLEIVGGSALPDDWQGDLITNDFRGHRVCRFKLSEDSAGFASRQMDDLIRSTHPAFRPIDVAMGPDGAVYIADWYNPIIQHGEVDFRDPRRDHTHGRIWRVTYIGKDKISVAGVDQREPPVVATPRNPRRAKPTGVAGVDQREPPVVATPKNPRRAKPAGALAAKPLAPPKLASLPTADLLDFLKSNEPWIVRSTRRVLKERADASSDSHRRMRSALESWVARIDADTESDLAVEQHRLEALWLHQAIRNPKPKLLKRLLRSPDHRVRAAATRVVGHWKDDLPDALTLLTPQAGDEHPRVRMEAVRVLAEMPDRRAVEIALSVLDQPLDEFLEYALWQTCRESQSLWLEDVLADRIDLGDTRRMTFALKSVGTPAAVAPLVRLLNQGRLQDDQRGEVLEVIAALGGPNELRPVFELAVNKETPVVQSRALLESLAEASRKRNVRPAGDLDDVRLLLDRDDQSLRAAAARCCGLWKLTAVRPELIELVESDKAGASVRLAAIEGLASLGDDESRKALAGFAAADRPRSLQIASAAALVRRDPKSSASTAVDVLARLDSTTDSSPIFAAFLNRKDSPKDLAAALDGREIPADAAKIGLRIVGASGREEPELLAALSKAGGIKAGAVKLSSEELAAMVAEVFENGDPHRGEAVFRREDLSCLKCHAVAGAGGKVGPDLLSLGASAQPDYLIQSLLDPNAKVKENYHSLVVVTDEGKVHSGVKVRQSDRDLILRDAEDKEIAIPLDSIEEQKVGASLMPAGLTEKLTRPELVDLTRFMSELGKVGPFAVSNRPVVRRWRALLPTQEAVHRIRRTSYQTASTDDDAFTWRPAYTRVNGVLPMDELPGLPARYGLPAGSRGAAFVRAEIEVTTAGKVDLVLNSPEGLTLWVDGSPAGVARRTTMELSKGVHRLTFAIDLSERTTGLKVEAVPSEGATAQVKPVGGK